MRNQRSNNRLLRLGVAALMLGVFPGGGDLSATQSMVVLPGHVPPQIRRATVLGRTPANELVTLDLTVRLDQNLLDQTLEEIYGRNAPAPKHYLSSAEFAQRFGLAEKRQALKNFAQANGLTVDPAQDKPESMFVRVSGLASTIEKAFNVQFKQYKAADGQIFRAHDVDPTIPALLTPHLGAVLGLSNLRGVMHPQVHGRVPSSVSVPSGFTGGTGPGGFLAPADIKTIYGLSQTILTGAGQSVALLELDGYIPSDLPAYETAYGLTNTPITFVGVDGVQNQCGLAHNQTCDATAFVNEQLAGDNGMLEVALDMDMVAALAPGSAQVMVYEDLNSDQGVFNIYNQIATDNIAKVISSSWGNAELIFGSVFDNSESQIFQRMAVQGQTIYVASGDSGAYADNSTVSVQDPASQPFVTSVGGTQLSGSVAAPIETAWNSCGSGQCFQSSGGSSGGGVSAVWPLPGYQVGVSGLASQTARNVPDVALNAGFPYSITIAGTPSGAVGTSAAAPLWAAMTALVNQERVTAGRGTLGFANPTLYQLGTSTSTANDYTDTTSGDNGFYSAHAGYDNVTGWGSFKGTAMISAASGVPSFAFSNSLSSVFAYPNPWDTRKYALRQVTITNLPDGASVKIITLSGFWVKTLPTSFGGSTVWDLTNDAGARVASGLYFYLANFSNNNTRGVIAIIK